MAKKISHVAAGILLALGACAQPSDRAAAEASEREGCYGKGPEAPCPAEYCYCWSHPEMCHCAAACACFRQHGR